MKKETPPKNLLEMKPIRVLEHKRLSSDQIAILVPKFRGKILGKYFQPRLKNPYFQVKLDDYGTFVWDLCDGQTTVFQIGERMKERFGDTSDPVYDRLSLFLYQLEANRFIKLTE